MAAETSRHVLTRAERLRRREWALLATPLIVFLLLFLGFPTVVDIVYSLSQVTFETLRSPQLSGFGNYADVVADSGFWSACWFSLRFNQPRRSPPHRVRSSPPRARPKGWKKSL